MTTTDRLRRWRILTLNWEYWPWPVIYLPVFIQYLLHSLAHLSFTFPTLINRPFMEFGGIMEESKLRMAAQIPKGWTPRTFALPAFRDVEELQQFLQYHRLFFPLIVKPDRGMRGKGVKKINGIKKLLEFTQKLQASSPYIIQEYKDYPREIGVLMIKDHENGEWKISSLMEREFPGIVGNGRHTTEQLIRQQDRLFLQLPRLQKDPSIDMGYIPDEGEKIQLHPIGNHRLGTTFRDAHKEVDEELKMALSRICDLLKGFEYGRLDIRFHNWQSLGQLKQFSIIEVNGANSEPGHIYDPRHSLFYGWKVLLSHHRKVYRLSKKARQNGVKPVGLQKGFRLFVNYLRTMDLD